MNVERGKTGPDQTGKSCYAIARHVKIGCHVGICEKEQIIDCLRVEGVTER
jgi:hypothetical protein